MPIIPPSVVAVASDHAAPRLRALLAEELAVLGVEVIDLGADGSEPVDYPDYAEKLTAAILHEKAQMGLLICGSGIGMSIAANRHAGIRAALCHNEETARLARQHNDANVLCLGARVMTEAEAQGAVRVFFSTPFEGGRHQRRVEKLG